MRLKRGCIDKYALIGPGFASWKIKKITETYRKVKKYTDQMRNFERAARAAWARAR